MGSGILKTSIAVVFFGEGIRSGVDASSKTSGSDVCWAMDHNINIQVRFVDTDALSHINNSAFAHYAEHARIQFFQDLGGKLGHLILARLAIDFRSQVHFGSQLSVNTQVANVGNSSIQLHQVVSASSEALQVAAEIESVVVYFDYEENRPMRVPEELRERLENFAVV
jgi:acyl-CoA thioester hydrolase